MIGVELASRYRIDRSLGEGGMGRVYEALDQQLGRHVAIKLIRDDLEDEVARERFLREARAAATLSHANACQLFEVGEHDGRPFLVMELLQGEPLSTRLERGPLPKDEAVTVLLALTDVLSAFHAAGLIHRDLKPSNVFLTEQGVKLLDFGLARRTQRADTLTTPALTVPGAVTGTVRYMAPEQITGDPVDNRTDIFALGVLLYEMLAGHAPFGAKTNVEWLNAVLTDDPAPLDDPELQGVDAVVMRALRRNPDDRYESIDAMAADLRQAAGIDAPRPLTAFADSAPSGAGKPKAVVLPFRLLQPDDQIAVLQHGLPDALTPLLSARPGWRLVSNLAAQKFAEVTDPVEIGRSLGVARLLSGSLLRVDHTVRVTVQWIDAADGAVRWSQTSEHAIDSVLTLQDDICQRIFDGLTASVDPASAGSGSTPPSAPGADHDAPTSLDATHPETVSSTAQLPSV
jgi:serine/threonine protein kinase